MSSSSTAAPCAPPYPPCAVGSTGPVPLKELPVREPPKASQQCGGWPGGSLVDRGKLNDRDHFLNCFIECCRLQKNTADPEASKLVGPDEWTFFVQQLKGKSLVDDTDVDLLKDMPDKINDGIDIWELQRWLFNKLYADDMRNFEKASEAMRGALHSVNISICGRGLQSLSQKELYTYQVLLSEYEHSVAENLRETLQRIEKNESEFERRELEGVLQEGDAARASGVAVGAAFLTGADPGPIPTTPEQFQWTCGPEIERQLRDIRVTSVAFPAREHVLGQTEWGLRRLLGVVSGTERVPNKYTDKRIEVLEIPWNVPVEYAESVANECDRMEALKHLAMSKYFRDYLGFDFSSYSGVGLHYLAYEEGGVSLRELIATSGPLAEGHALFRYWAREILSGLRDYLYQCCHEVTEDLTLEHVFVTREGLEIFFKDVPFGGSRGMLYEDIPEYGPRYKWRNGFVAVENRLLNMFGNMLLEMLYGREPPNAPVRTLQELSTGLQSLISLSVNARDTLDYLMLQPGGSPAFIERKGDVQALAGGLVTAGIDEFDSGEEYKLWWLREPTEPLILPNPERTADDADGGTALADSWRISDPSQQELHGSRMHTCSPSRRY